VTRFLLESNRRFLDHLSTTDPSLLAERWKSKDAFRSGYGYSVAIDGYLPINAERLVVLREKKTWDLFFSCSGDPIVFDVTSMTVTAASDVGFVVATMHCTEPGAAGERRGLDFRLTIGLRKMMIDGLSHTNIIRSRRRTDQAREGAGGGA
jgi:hypothetical protein